MIKLIDVCAAWCIISLQKTQSDAYIAAAWIFPGHQKQSQIKFTKGIRTVVKRKKYIVVIGFVRKNHQEDYLEFLSVWVHRQCSSSACIELKPKWKRRVSDKDLLEGGKSLSNHNDLTVRIAPLVVTAGILERKDETPAAPFRVDQPRMSAISSDFCHLEWFLPSGVISANGSSALKCTRWYHQHYGHCVHCYAIATYKGFMREERPCQAHRIHGTDLPTFYHKIKWNVGKYTSPMDAMG